MERYLRFRFQPIFVDSGCDDFEKAQRSCSQPYRHRNLHLEVHARAKIPSAPQSPPRTISAARPFARLRGGAGAEKRLKREAIGCLADLRWDTSEGP